MNSLVANPTKQARLLAGELSLCLPWLQGLLHTMEGSSLKVLKHLPAKIADYLHREHGHIFPSMGLPRKSAPLDRIQVMFIVMY